jgi:hypothetical protein
MMCHLCRHKYSPSIFTKIFISNTKYLIAGCLLWKFLAETEVTCDYSSIDVLNVGDKLNMTTNVSRLVDLIGEFPAEIIFSPPQNDSIVTRHITGSPTDSVT